MPFRVVPANTPEAVRNRLVDEGGSASLELVPRNCSLEEYSKTDVPSFKVKDELIAYASPDSTYAVTRRLLDAATTEIVIGIYDFSADYMKDILLNAMQRGVTVSLKLDIDGKKEEDVFEELAKFGCETVAAPSCASENVSYFPSSHEKVIVIDGTWTLVQSGNYSKNSIPFNEKDGGDPDNFVKGNRDMGVAIRSKPLAAFFSRLLRSDMQLELDGARAQAAPIVRLPEPDLVEAVPELLPSALFKSKTFAPKAAVNVSPVISPENYMDLMLPVLRKATTSIHIEQQYIRSDHPDVERLLLGMAEAREAHPELDVRIILGKLFGAKDVPKEKANIARLKKLGFVLGDNIRYIDTKRFVHCHNKLIIIDGRSVLISSQNWSRTGVGSNREAGVLVAYPALARYYTSLFESDWSTALRKIPQPKSEIITPEAVARGNFVEVRAADYQEV